MDSVDQIHIDFAKAVRHASDLTAIARDVRKCATSNLGEIEKGISIAWRSDNSARYLNKVYKVQGDIETTADNLEKIADTIIEIAKTTYDAEMRAWEIANERTE